jgi:Cu(I)/Ag(I) efflux system membrane fusion protein
MRMTRRSAKIVIPLVVIAALVLVAVFVPRPAAESETGEFQFAVGDTVWTCSMHPQVRESGPGQCPICGMDLIPLVEEEEGAATGRQFTISEAGKKLMEIETSEVERRPVAVEVRLPGMVAYDETEVARIAAWVPGRIDRLHIDYTGATVAAGEPMVELYSPQLIAAQEELLQSAAAASNAPPGPAGESARATLDAVRERLALWGLADAQIDAIEKRGTAEPHVTILAPMGGTVVEKSVTEGTYVSAGTPIYTIADLSNVWVELSAYESDLPWMRVGLPVDFATDALPGTAFHGTISFIDPVLDPGTRTARVRVDAPNEDGRLKPGMFARAIVRSDLGVGERPLVVPASAPLLTGKRAVVYVEVPGAETPTYEGREVVLGPRAGDYYVVVSGLKAGDRVVTKGNFKIDSALQIHAQPSMMNPEGD